MSLFIAFLALISLFNINNIYSLDYLEIKKNDLAAVNIKSRKKIKVIVGILNNSLDSEIINYFIKSLKKVGSFDIDVKKMEPIKTVRDLVNLYNSGYLLAIFLSEPNKQNIEWRIYDLLEKNMIIGKRVLKKGSSPQWHAYNLTDSLLPSLTGQEGSFSSQISYVKKVGNDPLNRANNIVCSTDIDGISETILIKKPGIYVGSYWHPDNKQPKLFCSEFTKSNVRLISVGLTGKKQIVLSMPGTCVGVSLSKNNDAVYCRSGNIWHYSHDKENKTGTHVQVINNNGKNIYPTLLENGDIIFCSDSTELSKEKRKIPRIYRYKKDTGTVNKFEITGYCLGPTYNKINNKIAYSKKLNGIFQLFIYNIDSKQEKQVTFDSGNKIDPCWSGCGNYLTYCYQKGKISRIAIININNLNRFFITSEKDNCSSPSWSPTFEIFTDSQITK